ncbi:hypothetical protein TNCV_684521 [Trichonephila clavipes]|nr:hypothetical protein TNCV_684521 [Trichonephila clavipes]
MVTWTTPELAPPSPNYHTTPTGDVSALDRFSVHRCPHGGSIEDIAIPRLELSACYIGARLTSSIRKAMNLEDIKVSQIPPQLFLIQHEVGAQKNRVENLSSKEAWKHLPGTCNPADLPSRGCSV